MAFKALASTAILLILNLLFFTMVSSQCLIPPPPKSLLPAPSPKRTPKLTPPPSPKPAGKGSCPKDTLKFGVCANVLKNLVSIVLGKPPKTHCCILIKGLVDLEAAVCLCTAMKANVLGVNLNIPVSLTLLLNYCGKKVPSGFQCA